MTTVQYMTPTGDWAISCQVGTPPPSLALVEAPADPHGDRGRDGMRWTGSAWIDDPGAAARAWAVMYPAEALAAERGAMVADKWQLVAALDLIDPGLWPLVETYRASPECDRVTARAIDYAITLPRVSETIDMLAYLLGMDAGQVDDLYRLAMTIRG